MECVFNVASQHDENGIPQEPRFGVSSFRGNAIKEWATKLYEQVVKGNTNPCCFCKNG